MTYEEIKDTEALIREVLSDWQGEILTEVMYENLISILTDFITSRFEFTP